MNNFLKIRKLREKNIELLKFIESSGSYKDDEVGEWISECVVHFTELKIDSSIISHFLSSLAIEEKEVRIENDFGNVYAPGEMNDKKTRLVKKVGPFKTSGLSGYFGFADNLYLNRDGLEMVSIKVAFKVAEKIIDNYEEEERLIPKTLINIFNTEKMQSIFLSLESVESNFEDGNTKGILTSLVTATSLILDLIIEVKDIKEVGKKIKKIYEEKKIYSKYSMNRDVLWALNNSRIIRNYDIHDPNEINNTPMHEAVSYAHILVLFINSLLSSGEIKL
jgi:hypothetical protein